jgi:ANTAR domain-containing protein
MTGGKDMDAAQRDESFWRGRAEELQHALTSRVVVEQAKGVLAERLGLNIEGAFSVLRGAARSERVKVHDLARTVVKNKDTPQTIITFLARNSELFHVSSRDERVVRTEEFFKRVNDTMRNELNGGDGKFLCECGNIACTEKLALGAEDLRLLHSIEGYFVVLPGHHIPEIETLVKKNGHYAIVHNNAG